MHKDGDGWVTCGIGHPHWGLHGAAGLLLRSTAGETADRLVLLQLRVRWSHHGGTWGLLGGARDSHESPVDTALREAAEEGGIGHDTLRIATVHHDDHGRWSYSTVIADADAPFPVAPASAETDELRWVPEREVADLPLHPHFALTWPALRQAPAAPLLVVDAANVVGSRPDGWWHDRLGATRRLRERLAGQAEHGLAVKELPFLDAPPAVAERWFAEVLLVVEGAARPLASEPTPAGVRIVAAERSGDDAIVQIVTDQTRHDRRTTVVVTADRALRQRCAAADPLAVLVGPGWLHGAVD